MAPAGHGLESNGTIPAGASMTVAVKGRGTLTVSDNAFLKARHCPDKYWIQA